MDGDANMGTRKVQDNCLRLYLLDPTIKIQAQSNDFAITSNISYIAVKRTAPRCIRNVKYNERDTHKDKYEDKDVQQEIFQVYIS